MKIQERKALSYLDQIAEMILTPVRIMGIINLTRRHSGI